MITDVIIAAAARTPIGRFGGGLAELTATELGGTVIRAVLHKAGIEPAQVDEVFMGNVLSAGLGQAPATQAAISAGLHTVPATSVNKVCASGMKAIMFAAQSITTGDNDIVVAGGMESMSNTPYYMDKARRGYITGHSELTDSLLHDGLVNVYDKRHMGRIAEKYADQYAISRKTQDDHAAESYRRARTADFTTELIPVNNLYADEEPGKINAEKIPGLKPVFKADGTITAANASGLNDGAAALLLMSHQKAAELHVQPLARIRGYADAQLSPEAFGTAPAAAIPLALQKAGLTLADIDYFEINEAFSVVALANRQLLDISPERLNVNGGAVALGHPLGASGARIVVTLLHILQQRQGRLGAAAICNGGGGASVIIIERL